jgi:cytochrome c biogenesis protein CcmG/thiol:disulfide interchange protein DsbE
VKSKDSPDSGQATGQGPVQGIDRLLAAAIVLLAGALVWVVAGTMDIHVTNAGDQAPDFKIVGDDGKTYTRSDFGGKLLVLNFWASWCAPCVQEVPSLEAFQHVLGPQGVVVLGVSIDTSQKRYEQFLRRFRVDFPTARDPEANISSKYGTFLIPETYLIDSTGKVREKIISSQNWVDPQFLDRVKTMLR